MTTVALAIASNGKPIFFQKRPGKYGRIFRIIKFKTMNDKKDAQGNLLSDAERLTAVGRFVRKTSLDEIPQLINVLKGDMSLIGPRPLLPEYLPLYNQTQKRRHEVKPGITGWAQVNGRNAISWEEKFNYDVWYVDHCGFRVGRRAVVNIQRENFNSITTEHNGYRDLGITHQRTIEKSSTGFKISDNILGPAKNRIIQGHLHFHPENSIVISENLIQINNKVQVKFNFVEDLIVQNYKFADGFNLLRDGKKIIYTFKQSCCFEINRIV